ncbi:MAG TPA: hypothetical protein VI935_08415 [Thermodesulfobacteriota bacterium]|nr:hypothetical protein [Thermodesulfobacteriota bacterium]
MEIEEIQESVDKITQLVVAILCISVAGGILTIAAIALFGPQMSPLMQKLPF